MENDYQFQTKMILFYLKENGSITAREAKQLCGCKRMDLVIRYLKKIGLPIKTETKTYKNRAGNKFRYAIYSLEE